MIYDVKLHGSNYNFKNGKDETIATGFFVYIFVKSDIAEEVERLAISNLIKNEIYIENIKPAETLDYKISIDSIEIVEVNISDDNILSEFVLYKKDDIEENYI